MKKLQLVVGISLLSTFVMAFTSIRNKRATTLELPMLTPATIKVLKVELKPEVLEIKLKNHDAFLDAIGHRESSGNYKAVNRYGYLGKYQFGKSTLDHIKIKVDKETFLNSPKLQEEAMHRLLLANKKSLRKYIRKYNNKTVHGVYITESGLLAAAHLGGAGSVRKFLKKGYQFKDGNGTKLTSYIEQFAGYTLTLNE